MNRRPSRGGALILYPYYQGRARPWLWPFAPPGQNSSPIDGQTGKLFTSCSLVQVSQI
jgi:hypothetical protein